MQIEGKEYNFRINGKLYNCAMDVTMGYIGGKCPPPLGGEVSPQLVEAEKTK